MKEGYLFRQARLKKGLTQFQVATRLGLKSPQQVSNWERGSAPVAMENFKGVAKIFGPEMIARIIKLRVSTYKKMLQGQL